MLKLLRIALAIVSIILIAHLIAMAVSAADLGVQPRAVGPFNWISETFVSGPLGRYATMMYLSAWLGLQFLLFILRYRARETDAKKPYGYHDYVQRRRAIRAERKQKEFEQSRGELNEIIAEMNLERVVTPQPAWQLQPIESDTKPIQVGSWLGGKPVAPSDFQWPTFSDGKPLMFLAQICLAEVKVSPYAGERPYGLPDDGALLIFLGHDGQGMWEYDAQWFPAIAMLEAVKHRTPTDAITPREIGFFWYEPAMKYTPVKLHCILDDEKAPMVSKFMGVENGDPFGYHFPEGFQTLIFIKHDDAIGTASEEWQGMAIACPTANLARGAFDGGILIGNNTG